MTSHWKSQDVALLQLDDTADVMPIRLIDEDQLEAPGAIARTIGWGNTSMDLENLDSDLMLRQVDIPLAEFSSLNQPNVFDGSLTDNMIAAGFGAPRKIGCIGDSGGPLVMSEESRIDSSTEVWVAGRRVQLGTRLREGDSYTVFARVSFFRSWIFDVIARDHGAWLAEFEISILEEDSD